MRDNEKGEQDLREQFVKVFTNDAGMTARVCPQGHVYLQVGHTCISFRKEHFVDLAQIVHAAEHISWRPVPAGPRTHNIRALQQSIML